MKLERRSVFGWPTTAAGSAPCRNGMVAHYDGSNMGLAKKAHTSCRAYWRATRKFHMGPARGWADIGYAYGVCPHGYVFEGRGFGRQQAAQPGGNSTWTSVTFMSGPAEAPTAAQINAWRELRAYLRGKGVASAVRGHRDFISTSCPGGKLYAMVKDGTLKGAPAKPKPAPPAKIWTTEEIVKALPTLRRGDTGEHVESLQALLQARSHPEVAIDSDFGMITERALKSVQEWGGVPANGICDGKTWPVVLRVHR